MAPGLGWAQLGMEGCSGSQKAIFSSCPGGKAMHSSSPGGWRQLSWVSCGSHLYPAMSQGGDGDAWCIRPPLTLLHTPAPVRRAAVFLWNMPQQFCTSQGFPTLSGLKAVNATQIPSVHFDRANLQQWGQQIPANKTPGQWQSPCKREM